MKYRNFYRQSNTNKKRKKPVGKVKNFFLNLFYWLGMVEVSKKGK